MAEDVKFKLKYIGAEQLAVHTAVEEIAQFDPGQIYEFVDVVSANRLLDSNLFELVKDVAEPKVTTKESQPAKDKVVVDEEKEGNK
jgi:hypothetical protein